MMAQKTACIIGSGNWGSAIAKIVGENTRRFPDSFTEKVNMYMYEETVEGRKLTEIVNTEHENVKYLPGVKLPTNIVAIPDVEVAAKDADILIFVLPHQFVKKICQTLQGKTKPSTIAVSLIKGFAITDAGIELISNIISHHLAIPCAVLMGANLAGEVATEMFCETTIGCKDMMIGQSLKQLFDTEYFRCSVVDDAVTVEICGALKNVVGIGAGIVDGLNMGDNTKAAVIRLGLMEMIKFAEVFFPGCKRETFFESCGIADLVATCQGGRNRMLGEAVVKSEKTVHELEKELLHGQSFQGPLVAREVHTMLRSKNLLEEFPLFVAVNEICQRKLSPEMFVDCLRNHPEHI